MLVVQGIGYYSDDDYEYFDYYFDDYHYYYYYDDYSYDAYYNYLRTTTY